MFRNGEKQPKKLCLQTRLQTHLPTLSSSYAKILGEIFSRGRFLKWVKTKSKRRRKEKRKTEL